MSQSVTNMVSVPNMNTIVIGLIFFVKTKSNIFGPILFRQIKGYSSYQKWVNTNKNMNSYHTLTLTNMNMSRSRKVIVTYGGILALRVYFQKISYIHKKIVHYQTTL